MKSHLFTDSPIPALARAVQFAAARQKLIASNIANIETPGFRPSDVNPREFQSALAESIEREQTTPTGGLVFDEGGAVSFGAEGLMLEPTPIGDNVLFHDGNDRSAEHLMQMLNENFYAFKAATQLVRFNFGMIDAAIRERP
ncbi:MAG: hypothetical protein EXS10_00805 [Phycisphaerales bacterium]|nr:hypothetical protein [Phycisphaerales bacterium]